ncbi:2168_t:CDS:2, partial [Racocetra persica]
MSDYIFDDDAHDAHSLDYEESLRDEELHIDNESPRDEKLSQDKELLKKGKPKKKNITVKYAHDSSTGNMLGYLWSKHRIDKEYSNEANT